MGKVCNFGAHLLQMMRRNVPDVIAARITRTANGQDCANLFWGEAERSRSANKAQSAKMAFIINPVAPFAAGRCIDRADALEISDCLNVHTSLPRQIAD